MSFNRSELFLIALAQSSHEFQARLSRIFLATIPVESISKVRFHSRVHALKSVNICLHVQAERLRQLFFSNSQKDF